jgi:hypothetical protein
MKLAAIYNVWDGVELLRGSMNCIKGHVELIIIVWQDVSNFGESYNPIPDIDLSGFSRVILQKYTPVPGNGMMNEKSKRNLGLDIARREGCTHFLHMDCDEYYEDFGKAKELFIESGKPGSVLKLMTYFKLPTLRFENPDNYFVPFIHELTEKTEAGARDYPFWTDPTRRINVSEVVELPVFMHHFSWVRLDIERKARNSSAKKNIENSFLMEDYRSEVGTGSYIRDYQQKLIEVEDIFRINQVFCNTTLT